MKLTIFLTLATVAVTAAKYYSEDQYQTLFNQWTKKHGKTYSDAGKFFERFNIFKGHVDMIYEHNELNDETYRLGLNEFSDLAHEEFRATMVGGTRPNLNARAPIKLDNRNVPSSRDWRAEGAVTPVKNQGECGSCWAFSTTGSMEGAHFIANGTLLSFSEQELVDCAGSSGNQGCNGGLMDNAFKWIVGNGGLCLEKDYPYEAKKNMFCKKSSCKSAGTLSGWQDVEQKDEDALKTAVGTIGPVSIAIEADKPAFQHYQSGVFTGTCGTQLDHGVLIVGYGRSSGLDYWIVKNSWGTTWGDEGYIKVVRGKNECGISMAPSYPVV